MNFKVRWRREGAHISCRVFVAKTGDRNFVLAGRLILHPEEFEGLRRALEADFVEDRP